MTTAQGSMSLVLLAARLAFQALVLVAAIVYARGRRSWPSVLLAIAAAAELVYLPASLVALTLVNRLRFENPVKGAAAYGLVQSVSSPLSLALFVLFSVALALVLFDAAKQVAALGEQAPPADIEAGK